MLRLCTSPPLCDIHEPVPSVAAVLGYAMAMAVVTFAIGLITPPNSVILNVDVHDFPQYPLMFAAGAMAWRHGWLLRLPSIAGRWWLAAGLVGGGLLWFALIVLGGALQGHLRPYGGGWHWQAAGMDVWRSFTGVALSLGLITLYRDRFNTQGPLAQFLARNAFGVYVFHAPILIAVTRILHIWPLVVGAKFLAASLIATTGTFLFVAFVVRRTPGLRAIV
jgi:hypothetical protein